MYYLNYADYLKSEAWSLKRRAVWRRDKGKCQHCGEKGRDVHHKEYPEVLGEEEIDTLVLLCRSCHRYEHGHTEPTLKELSDMINNPKTWKY